MACQDTCYSFFVVSLAKVFVLLCLLDLSPASHNGVTLLLEGSLKPCHLPLPAGREVAGIGLWEWWRELEGSLFCSSEQLLLLLKENSVYVANCNSEVLCNARRAHTFETLLLPPKAGALESAVNTLLAPRTDREQTA